MIRPDTLLFRVARIPISTVSSGGLQEVTIAESIGGPEIYFLGDLTNLDAILAHAWLHRGRGELEFVIVTAVCTDKGSSHQGALVLLVADASYSKRDNYTDPPLLWKTTAVGDDSMSAPPCAGSRMPALVNNGKMTVALVSGKVVFITTGTAKTATISELILDARILPSREESASAGGERHEDYRTERHHRVDRLGHVKISDILHDAEYVLLVMKDDSLVVLGNGPAADKGPVWEHRSAINQATTRSAMEARNPSVTADAAVLAAKIVTAPKNLGNDQSISRFALVLHGDGHIAAWSLDQMAEPGFVAFCRDRCDISLTLLLIMAISILIEIRRSDLTVQRP